MIHFEIIDNTGFAELFDLVVPKVSEAIQHNAAKLQTDISLHAPRGADSGDKVHYADSFAKEDISPLSVEVGTDRGQGYRLEQGFHGTDALGRHYEQAGRPHVAPAAQVVEGSLINDLYILLSD